MEDQSQSALPEEVAGSDLMDPRPTWTAYGLETIVEDESELEAPVKNSDLDLVNSRPTQTALEQEITMEDQRRSAWVAQVSEKQRCHFVGYVGSSSGSGSNGAGDESESILAALDSEFDVVEGRGSPANSEEYDVLMKGYEAEFALEQPEAQPSVIQQVYMTNHGNGGGNDASTEDKTPVADNGAQAKAADAEAADSLGAAGDMPPPAAPPLQQQ